mmetsp:Transcript_66888/g.204849  ORF Transcript_66888/g.204849 Transcript_66888/m.204849 type:complete len:226 (-) Transcript_66888:863-1540(-)
MLRRQVQQHRNCHQASAAAEPHTHCCWRVPVAIGSKGHPRGDWSQRSRHAHAGIHQPRKESEVGRAPNVERQHWDQHPRPCEHCADASDQPHKHPREGVAAARMVTPTLGRADQEGPGDRARESLHRNEASREAARRNARSDDKPCDQACDAEAGQKQETCCGLYLLAGIEDIHQHGRNNELDPISWHRHEEDLEPKCPKLRSEKELPHRHGHHALGLLRARCLH